jgi:hypothetical protein
VSRFAETLYIYHIIHRAQVLVKVLLSIDVMRPVAPFNDRLGFFCALEARSVVWGRANVAAVAIAARYFSGVVAPSLVSITSGADVGVGMRWEAASCLH